ncbi:carbohydrate esterase family 16 protein [Karstenula rhodostoma CBS 690.94]|uniref:Carbohydrate esterase family 16 protein n=1 Tax=Karstenula rhodostoma CBS 690.94 TaxID=1392251 RepID=A0A9P4UB64_9PLEO|nr:carbohydrate esterase family 16 protein [Karstenula rhodostoma CBS 690.94]
MRWFSFSGILLGAVSAQYTTNAWQAQDFKTLVAFGDSYTDENRLGYFGSHNGSAPPIGVHLGVSYKASTGGLVWPRYASIYTNSTLYNYAVSGAVCSNKITPRTWASINAPFPDILGYELPAYLADSKYISPNGTAFFTGTPSTTVYTIWIGTNDVGNNAFLTDSQVAGKVLTDYVDCVYHVVDGLYQNGARYFVLLNLAPLNLLPQYATPARGGLNTTQFFPDKQAFAGGNMTEISYRMLETVDTVNAIYAYRTPFETRVNATWPGANIANFDVNALITDMYANPEEYLNGTAPLNITGYVVGAGNISRSDRDSYLWYDELHPSEQVDRVVAREFVGVLGGASRWAKYW